jgi:hypothetical protein
VHAATGGLVACGRRRRARGGRPPRARFGPAYRVESTNALLGLPGSVVVVGAAVVVVTGAPVVVVGAAVVVVVPPQASSHASQQLADEPTHAVPPFGAVHFSALFLIEHFTLPRRSMRQQVTAPGFPQVDLAAHRTTAPLHSVGRAPLSARAFATCPTHFTYCPWFSAVAQSHSAAAAARAAATAASSVHFFAGAAAGTATTKANATSPVTNDLIVTLLSRIADVAD